MKRPPAVAGKAELQLKVALADRHSTKKQQSGQLMGVRIEGHVMVHRTDVASGSSGQTTLGHDGMCRRLLNGVPLENNFVRKRQHVPPSHHGVAPAHTIAARTRGPRRL
jgi:hypothetical protein